MRTFEHPRDLAGLVGQEVATSDWITVTQQQIDLFAQATGDHQWIHVDPARAKDGPFGTTIAHGFLTLSLIPQFFAAAIDVRNTRMGRDTLAFGAIRSASLRVRSATLGARQTTLEQQGRAPAISLPQRRHRSRH